MAKARKPNPEIARGINKLGRSASYARKGLFAIKRKNGGSFPKHAKAVKPAPAAAAPRFYPAEDAPKPLHKKKTSKKAAGALRASITPGTVLILLAGRFKGKRVVFLKQLPSGLLLVTGPYAVNGVPARRVNAAYVIATSTRIDVAGVNSDAFTDAFFAKPKKDRSKSKSAEEFFAAPSAAKELPAGYLAAQAALDSAVKAKLNEATTGYLNTLFTLRAGDKPHAMRF